MVLESINNRYEKFNKFGNVGEWCNIIIYSNNIKCD